LNKFPPPALQYHQPSIISRLFIQRMVYFSIGSNVVQKKSYRYLGGHKRSLFQILIIKIVIKRYQKCQSVSRIKSNGLLTVEKVLVRNVLFNGLHVKVTVVV
jgi:hypothetical protein